MAISYNNLWKLLIDKGMSKSQLRIEARISTNVLAKLGKNGNVSTEALERICRTLNCEIGDIMEIKDVIPANPDDVTASNQVQNSTANTSALLTGNYSDSHNYKIVSLFSGCGGLDLGFRGGFSFLGKEFYRNPFEIIWANEMNKAACATYRKNVDTDIDEGRIEDRYQDMPKSADVVIGGFPCQDISINGKMAGVDGKRSGLYVWMVKAVKELQPKIFVAENVKALLMKRHEDSLNRVIQDFSEIGYRVSYHLYDAADYGVPQVRQRVVIVGVRKDIEFDFVPPLPTTHDKPITVEEAIGDLETHEYDEAFSHIWSAAKPSSGQGLAYRAL